MDKKTSISEAQMKVMDIIWKQGEMVTVPEMVALLKEEGKEWAYPTVATFLRRLAEKKILGSIKNGKKLSYFPLMNKAEYKRREARRFVKQNFGGSIRDFLSAFSGKNSVSDEEEKELEEWLRRFDDDNR